MRRVVAWWGAWGVVFAGATQLRSAALPIGPGEALLASWIFLVLLLLLTGRLRTSPVSRLLFMYWLASAALLGFGTMMAIAMDRVDTSSGGGPMHDAVAYALLAAFSCSLSLRWQDDSQEYYLTIIRVVFFTFATCTTIMLCLGMVVPSIGPVRFWYAGVRFAAWAENPNQLALFALVMPFLGWYLGQRARGWRRLAYGLAIVGVVAVGLATKSDGLRVSWLASVGLVCLIAWYHRPLSRQGPLLPYISYIIIPALLVVSLVAFGPELLVMFERAATDLYADAGQGEIRFTVWLNGLRALAESPLVGWGPGAFSGLHEPFEGFEAHNTLIDWAASTGALGLALHAALWVWCASRALRMGVLPLFGGLVSLMIDSMFGYNLRHPVYWLLLTMVLLLTQRREKQAPAAAQPDGSAAPQRTTGRRAVVAGTALSRSNRQRRAIQA